MFKYAKQSKIEIRHIQYWTKISTHRSNFDLCIFLILNIKYKPNLKRWFMTKVYWFVFETMFEVVESRKKTILGSGMPVICWTKSTSVPGLFVLSENSVISFQCNLGG